MKIAAELHEKAMTLLDTAHELRRANDLVGAQQQLRRPSGSSKKRRYASRMS